MKVEAKLKSIRISPRKSKLVADLIRGLDIKNAEDQLNSKVKKACFPMKKLLLSAVANAENNFGLDKDNLYVYDVVIGAGPTLKRWMPKAYGRAGRIMKRTSRITVVLEERIEGKGRKSKDQLEKERQERLKEKKRLEKEAVERAEKDKKEEGRKETKPVKTSEEKEIKKGVDKKSWGSRIFRRKSM
jgi:large subunit ribosomal protein L22